MASIKLSLPSGTEIVMRQLSLVPISSRPPSSTLEQQRVDFSPQPQPATRLMSRRTATLARRLSMPFTSSDCLPLSRMGKRYTPSFVELPSTRESKRPDSHERVITDYLIKQWTNSRYYPARCHDAGDGYPQGIPACRPFFR